MSDQKSYRIGLSSVTTAGTGTISASTTALTGSGTAFLTELFAGAVIISDGQTLAIASVTNDTGATLQTAPSPALSGDTFTIATMKLLTNLTVSVMHPKSSFKSWQEKIMLGNGLARAMGRPSTVWQWGYITQAQYDQLHAIIAGASSRVFIYTRTTETADSYKVYQAAGLWPDEVDRQATRRVNFSIEFRDLVLL
jgi:hypothetical protein